MNGAPADVLLVLGHDLYVRNYVASGWLRRLLARGLRVAVVVPGHTVPQFQRLVPELDNVYSLEPLRPTPFEQRLLVWLRLGAMVARRDQIAYRKKLEWSARMGLNQKLVIAGWSRIAAMTDPERVATTWMKKLPTRPAARRLVQEIQPRVVVWPTSISNPADVHVLKAVHELGIPTLMCEGSWDNLVTKGVIWPRPSRVAVWGEASREWAMAYQGFRDDEVVVTGPPHFDLYARPEALTPRENWFAQHRLDPAKRLIVFGSSGKFSAEGHVLRLLSGWIDAGQLPPSTIWYRRHPRYKARRQAVLRTEHENILAIPHVRLDPGVEDDDAPPNGMWTIHPEDARQRANLLVNCDAIVSAFSTLVLDGALLGKPAVTIGSISSGFGRSERTDAPTVFPYLEFPHVQKLFEAPWVRVAHGEESIRTELCDLLNQDPRAIIEGQRQFALTIARCGDGQGGERIIEAVESMLGGERERARADEPSQVTIPG